MKPPPPTERQVQRSILAMAGRMKAPVPTERQVQRGILQMMGRSFPNVLVWHVPNGAYLGANPNERKRTMGVLLGDGLKPGVPDLAVYWNHGHALLEVKRPGYSPSSVRAEQLAIHATLAEMGFRPAIVTSDEEVFRYLLARGAPWNGIKPLSMMERAA